MSCTSIWKLADNKAFLPAVCCSFKPTLILCAPAELAAGKERVSFGEIGKNFSERACPLFPCASARSLCKKGNLFYCHFLALPFYCHSPGRGDDRNASEGVFVLKLFLNFITCFCRVFFCVLKSTHDTVSKMEYLTVQLRASHLNYLDSLFPAGQSPFSDNTLIALVPSEVH